MKDTIDTSWLGLLDYQKALDLQHEHVENILSRGYQEVIMGLEHPSVITLGKRGGIVHPIDIPIIQTNRGGLATGHEPGQLVIYPIINIQKRQLRVREWVSLLEDSCIDFFHSHGLKPNRDIHSGIWINHQKIASIGLQIKKGISMHGISINICNTLSIFSNMIVCGTPELMLTSLEKENIQVELKTAFIEITAILIEKLNQKEAQL